MTEEEKQKRIDKAIEEKQERIAKYVDEKDENIRISWAINNAVEWAKVGDRDFKRIRPIADQFLSLFEEMKGEAQKEKSACQSCGGIIQYGGAPLQDGQCAACRKSNYYKAQKE